jgi:hypothetical protein
VHNRLQVLLKGNQVSKLNELFTRDDLMPGEVAIRVMDIIEISKTDLRKWPWTDNKRDPNTCISITRNRRNPREAPDLLNRLRNFLIAVAVEVNRYFHVRFGRMSPYYSPQDALNSEDFRMEWTIKAYIKGDFSRMSHH